MTNTTTTDPQDDLDAKIAMAGAAAAQVHTTNVTVVVDRSGSMSGIRTDVIGGLNTLIEEQAKEPGACSLTIWQFDSTAIEKMLDTTPITKARKLTNSDFQPRGMTPLYDAVGAVLADADARHQDGDYEVFVLVTDGAENSSREYTKQMIFDEITRRTSDGWVFSYLGANHDAYGASQGIGISKGSTQSFAADAAGASKSFASVSRSIGGYRGATHAGDAAAAAAATTDFFAGQKEAEDDLQSRTTKDPGTGKVDPKATGTK
jgi:uncharacterized protein YegL